MGSMRRVNRRLATSHLRHRRHTLISAGRSLGKLGTLMKLHLARYRRIKRRSK